MTWELPKRIVKCFIPGQLGGHEMTEKRVSRLRLKRVLTESDQKAKMRVSIHALAFPFFELGNVEGAFFER